MTRREMIGTLGLGTAALAVAEGAAGAAQHEHGEAHDDHLETLAECARVCNEVAHHCLEQVCNADDAKVREAHARIHEATMDCQAFCVLTAVLMARHSPMGHHAHAACAEACAQCAKVCEDSGVKSQEVQRCIEICRECEKACRSMTKAMEHHHHADH